VGDPRELFRDIPWPYADGKFPSNLGAVVQLTVLDGALPALVVHHLRNGDWGIGDGVNDPNLPGAAVLTHIWHAIEQNGSIAGLAHVPPGHVARRQSPADNWVVSEVSD
jgi:hypothetical protein